MPIPKTHHFFKSPKKDKKYHVSFLWKGKRYERDFGAVGYYHYHDRTGLGLYSQYDHNDDKRRALFWARFGRYKNNPKSSAFWSLHFLW